MSGEIFAVRIATKYHMRALVNITAQECLILIALYLDSISNATSHSYLLLYPRYEVYRGYIVFAFSVIMFVCLSVCWFVCLSVNFFFLSKISKQLLDLGF